MKYNQGFVFITIFVLLSLTSYIYPQSDCDSLIGFETIPRDTFGLNFDNAGDLIFTESNIDVSIDSITYSVSGHGYFRAFIESAFCGFGFGKIIHLNNVSLIFDLNQYNTNKVSFTFMDLGGDENFQVNGGLLYIINSFRGLPLNVASGVTCTVDSISADNCGYGGLIGKVTLNGSVNELLIAGQELWIDSICVDVMAGSLPENSFSFLPKKFTLEQNYPNPLNPSTTIEFALPKSEFVTLNIYSILGEEIRTLVSEKLNAGNHTYEFNARNLSSGIYLYRIEAGEFQDVKKMILLK